MKRATELALLLLGVSLGTLFVASAHAPLGPASSDYAALVNQAEDSVRRVAYGGIRALGQPEARTGIEHLTTRPLAPLLSAWSALSVGRLGLLDGSSSVRLPWLIWAGTMPASVFFLLRARCSVTTALSAALWLLASPGFVSGALSARPSALAVWPGWLVLVAYACGAGQRSWRARAAWAIVAATLAWVACGLSFASLWVAPVLLLHAWGLGGSGTWRAARRGQLPVPSAVLLVLSALSLAVFTFDPALWHAEVPSMIRRVFDDGDLAQSDAPRVTPFALSGALGLVGLVVLAGSALARHFATGEFRPRRDRAGVGLLLASALLCAALVAALRGAATEFALELARPILACLAAIGAAALGSRLFAGYARWASAALLLLSVLVR